MVVTPESRKHACLHEAGHAVGAVVLEIPFTGVWVAGVGDQLSSTTTHPEGVTFTPDYKLLSDLAAWAGLPFVRNIVALYLMGAAAADGSLPDANQPDMHNALEWAARLNPADAQSVAREQFQRARSLCAKHRKAIREVARRLEVPPRNVIIDTGTRLSAEEVREVVFRRWERCGLVTRLFRNLRNVGRR
jgi:hypothetical protein